MCDLQNDATHQPVNIAPRSILRSQIETTRQQGYTAMAGLEVEYYLFQDSYTNAANDGYRHLQPTGHYIEDYHILQGTREEDVNGAARRHLAASGIPIECTKGEWGLGQHELNLRYSDVVEMADRHSLYKHCLKETADGLGKSVSFMAKFRQDRAGSSCHVHLSLWSGDNNAFSGPYALSDFQCSQAFRWFLGGWLKHAHEFMVFYAPTSNSYKRFQSRIWAPTKVAWAGDNRTAGFRVVGSGNNLRIECRIPGADCNPYLVYAAALASGLDGITNRYEPPEAHEGDLYTAHSLHSVPSTLRESVELFSTSQFARDALRDDVVDHYTHFFGTEVSAFDIAVTVWERERYFERI